MYIKLYLYKCTLPSNQTFYYFWTAYGFYVTEYPDFGTTRTYTLGVTCVENSYPNTATATGSITIQLIENQAPTLTNLDSKLAFFSLFIHPVIY